MLYNYTCTCTIYYYTTTGGWGTLDKPTLVCVKTTSLPSSYEYGAAVKLIYVYIIWLCGRSNQYF